MKKVELFSKEIVKIGEKFVALPMITGIGEVELEGFRGHGDQYYTFNISNALSDSKLIIYGNEIPYWKLSSLELGWDEEEHPLYVNSKIEVLTLRDELLAFWSEYLENNRKENM